MVWHTLYYPIQLINRFILYFLSSSSFFLFLSFCFLFYFFIFFFWGDSDLSSSSALITFLSIVWRPMGTTRCSRFQRPTISYRSRCPDSWSLFLVFFIFIYFVICVAATATAALSIPASIVVRFSWWCARTWTRRNIPHVSWHHRLNENHLCMR